MEVILSMIGGRIAVQSSYAAKDLLAAIPGARWDFPRGCRQWTYPATPASLQNLIDEIGRNEIIFHYNKSDHEQLFSLAKQSREIAESQQYKREDYQLDPIPLPLPEGFKPWRHQIAAYWFTKNLPASLVWVGMGGGKSFIAMTGAARMRKVLIVCRRVAVESVWPAWIERIYPEPVIYSAIDSKRISPVPKRFEDARQKHDLAMREGRAFFLVVNHASVWREPFASWILKNNFDMLIVDECHKAASASTRITKFLVKLVDAIPRRMALSGTPLTENPLSAYGVFRWLDPGIFGTSFLKFRDRYCRMGGFENRKFISFLSPAAKEEFLRRVASITFFADDSVIELPPVQFIDLPFELPKEIMQMYQQLKRDCVLEVGEREVTAAHAFTKRIRLHQLANGFLVDDNQQLFQVTEAKLEALSALLEDIDPREPLVVFYKYKQDAVNIAKACEAAGRTSAELSGRIDELALWQRGERNVLITQMQVGSDSIDLTRAKYGIYYSMSDSLVDFKQSVRRLRRPPVTAPVTFYRLKARGTVDVDIHTGLEIKDEIIRNLESEAAAWTK